MSGGWFHRGDLTKKDADGYIFIVGRKKDLVITSGFNVYPNEIKNILNLHPSICPVPYRRTA
jgi:acyl-CoA synthetase (AMP-forming)/AMP-acid ligase II